MTQATNEPAIHKPTIQSMVTAAEIEAMERAELIALWQELFGTVPPKSVSRPFMRLALAYEVQASRMGGLPKGFVARLDRMTSDEAPKRSPGLQPGGRLLREWNGVTHVIDVPERGYASLSPRPRPARILTDRSRAIRFPCFRRKISLISKIVSLFGWHEFPVNSRTGNWPATL